MERPARNATVVKPITIKEKYSGGPKLRATAVSIGPRRMSPKSPMVPATNDAIAAMPRAAPARPCKAI